MTPIHRFLILGLIAFLAIRCAGTAPAPTLQPPAPPEVTTGTATEPTRRPQDSLEAPTGSALDPTLLPQVSSGGSSDTSGDWQAASPESQGMDSNLLAEMFLEIEEGGTDLDSLMILRNGSIVLEAYFFPNTADRKHVMFSITKSFMATLTGIALELGYIESVDQRIVDLLPETSFDNPDPRKEQVTLEDVLTMTSGLGWEEIDPTFAELYYQEDWIEYVLGKPMVADPGSLFSYCSGCSHILSAVLQERTGQDLLQFARENLFEPLGISDFNWETDRSGLPIGGWGLELTTRDMAKIGILYLNQGSWKGTQVIPAEWIDAAVEYHTDTGDGLGYGYQWWIYPDYEAYAALGRGGQTVFVIPDKDLIISTTAETPNHDPIIDLIDGFILPAVRSDQGLPPNPEGEKRLRAIIDQISQP